MVTEKRVKKLIKKFFSSGTYGGKFKVNNIEVLSKFNLNESTGLFDKKDYAIILNISNNDEEYTIYDDVQIIEKLFGFDVILEM